MLKQALKIGLIIVLALTACDKSGNFPEEPIIKYEGYKIVDGWDSILWQPATLCEITISFTDGDGDIGVVVDSTTDNNLLVNYYEIKGGLTDTLDQIDFSSKIPVLTPAGQNKSLKGEISLEMNITNRGSDSLIFDLQLLDRSVNASNIVVTPTIAVE
ncbi:MAG: hypothetical protein ACI8ZO_000331 [Flavobacteriales bacterium]|jgi:hypothetical protein